MDVAGPLGDGKTSEPLAALEHVIAPQLDRGPCCVSFSGGIDSSLILSVATSLARRIGAPDPVPLTWRFDKHAERAEESDWQEAVVAELGLADWQRLDAGDDLDWTGPVAADVLRRHGLLYPANAFVHAPLAKIARGGSLLTGIGGDQMLGLWRGREVAAALSRRRRPEPGDVRSVAIASLPAPVRSAAGSRLRPASRLGWLTAEGQSEFNRLAARERFSDPVSWNRHLQWRRSRRDTALSLASLRSLSLSNDSRVVAPLLDPGLVSALARAGGRWGAGSRAATLERWFAGAVPEAVRARPDKARFRQVFWREPSRQIARALAAEDALAVSALIDPAGLVTEWASDRPSSGTALLLQQLWLARDSTRSALEPVRPSAERA